MKIERKLSKIKFKFIDKSGVVIEKCFEDFSYEQQFYLLNSMEKNALQALCLTLASALNEIGEDFNIEKV